MRANLLLLLAAVLCLTATTVAWADDKADEVKLIKHQITGLFCPELEQDFKSLCAEKLARFKLVRIDYANAEATSVTVSHGSGFEMTPSARLTA